jgi:methionyl-tRNA synthetase
VGSAYTTIVCDVLARYKRMCGYDVAFLTGTDEHGEKLQRAADEAGVPVGQFVAEKRELFPELWRKLGVPPFNAESPSEYGYRFVHTSQNPAHVSAVQWMIRQADKAGYIEKKRYEGRYCIYDERYVSDGSEPVNCDICGRPAELISEENYFFKLSAFGGEHGRLMTLYREHPEFVQPDFRRNEVISFVKGGLRDISISRRRLKWGISWPGDSEQVVYVWYDALTSYMTGIGFAGENRSDDFEKYWKNDGTGEVVHMIGKDILRFHAVYWPAFLMAANDALPDAKKLPLPKTVFAHGWIYYEQDKMSKSKGNVVYPEPIIDAFESFGAPGNDALRYYLLREAPFGQDTSFSYEALIHRYNSDLANDLGNLSSRTLTMIEKYFRGVVPDLVIDLNILTASFNDEDPDAAEKLAAVPEDVAAFVRASKTQRIIREAERLKESYTERFNSYDFFYGLANTFGIAEKTAEKEDEASAFLARVNKYISDTAPWHLAESGTETWKAAVVLYVATEALRFLAVLLAPVLPDGVQRLWQQLGCEGSIKDHRFSDLKWGGLKPGTKVGKPEPIFPRLDKAKALAKLEEYAEADRERSQPKGATIVVPSHEPSAVSSQPSAPAESRTPKTESRPTTDNQQPTTAKIMIDDFAKVEMVVGQIVSAEAIPGAKKLLKLQVDIGTETRQVCAGIAEFYKPEEVTGMKIVLVANLEPRKLRGVESNGMVVAASIGPEGRPVLATFKEDVPNGTRLK